LNVKSTCLSGGSSSGNQDDGKLNIESTYLPVYGNLTRARQANLGSAHTTPEEFENAVLFPRLGLPFTLIRHEKGAFQKRSSNQRNLETQAFRFSVDWKHCENGAFRKRRRHDI